ncbi:hypothetical protein TRIUR3_31107 [Triticum urartu]|uniref:Uncharacterized protein n=1 Tax=Triticum urartu TaxID=4572 RepID=M7YTN3_TRIUA|nr:hypothetical protein TRIUR3_31107 [Triticum urartu]
MANSGWAAMAQQYVAWRRRRLTAVCSVSECRHRRKSERRHRRKTSILTGIELTEYCAQEDSLHLRSAEVCREKLVGAAVVRCTWRRGRRVGWPAVTYVRGGQRQEIQLIPRHTYKARAPRTEKSIRLDPIGKAIYTASYGHKRNTSDSNTYKLPLIKRIGDGDSVLVWDNKWIPGTIPKKPFSITNVDKVADLIDPDIVCDGNSFS